MSNFDRAVDRRGTGSLKWDKYAGRDVLPLWVADMDFLSPPAVMEALRRRADHGVFGYTVPHEEATSAVLDYLRTRHALEVRPEWLVWLPGLVQGLNLTCRALGQAGDAVLTCTPVYPPFLSAPGFSDRTRITVPLALETVAGGGSSRRNEAKTDGPGAGLNAAGYRFDWDALEQAVTPDTKLFILCSPHNPVGRVWTRGELAQLLAFCERHDLVLCSDEIHCDLILEDLPHVPTLALGGSAALRTITLLSPSKTYNLPGLACAYALIPNEALREQFKRVSRGLVTEINAFGYAGCAAAYRHGEPWRQELLAYLRGNRDLIYAFAREHLPGIVLQPMEATYLAWLDVRGLGLEHPVKFFEDAGVGLSNGVDFGAPGFVRLNFGCPRSVLQEGLERMRRALK